MTTTIKVMVGGRYRATVTQDDKPPVVVDGNSLGGSGEAVFYLPHPAASKFEITEVHVPEGEGGEEGNREGAGVAKKQEYPLDGDGA